ncbi:unnamed protein product [Hymenolepis diminuta]|uniref:Uncharacterized protein n=1 Tax=Hymenolepis diminuta TaxID=6216 RepID=A0A564Y9U7_HYMDI|nr:unnamed protein product [Hymenolepis diminuta]
MASKNCSKKSAIAVGILCGVLLLTTIALIAIYGSFDKLVARMIYGNVAITPSSSVYSQWVSPDTPILFSIYLFNITNQKEIEKGGKPRVQQLGPYVYREKRIKTNITWPKDDTSQVSFYQRLIFTLDRNLSIGDPDKDTVIGISTPFVAIAANMEAGNGPSSEEYTFMTLLIKPKLFVKTSVTKFLWGYVDPITYVCNAFDSKKCPTPKVGLMLGKNGTDVGPFVIDTGVNDVTKLGNILTFQGKDTVDVWSSDKANQIIGTDGSHVAPDLTMDSRRFIFVADLCRSFEMQADGIGKLTNSDKIKVFSLSGTPETAQSAAMNPDNLGYCPPKTPGPKCPPAGTFDLSSCRRQGNLRPPVYSSQPYFLGADPALREGVDGLYVPSKDNASTKVFVEPKLGLVLEAYKRLQISIYVRPSKAMAKLFVHYVLIFDLYLFRKP